MRRRDLIMLSLEARRRGGRSAHARIAQLGFERFAHRLAPSDLTPSAVQRDGLECDYERPLKFSFHVPNDLISGFPRHGWAIGSMLDQC
jgi:hypothetical protein